MYVEPIVKNIENISILYQDPITSESNTLPHSNERGSHTKMVETPTLKRGTNTKITTENTTEITTNKDSCHKFETCDMEHAKLLFQLILETNPEHKEPNLEKWANEFRLIRERDKKTNQQIVYLLEWSQHHSF